MLLAVHHCFGCITCYAAGFVFVGQTSTALLINLWFQSAYESTGAQPTLKPVLQRLSGHNGMHSAGLRNPDDTVCVHMVCSATRQATFHRILLACLCVYLIFYVDQPLTTFYYLAITACEDISAALHKQTARIRLAV